ncbi:unnamed protein product [Chrysoparadoxa australica]
MVLLGSCLGRVAPQDRRRRIRGGNSPKALAWFFKYPVTQLGVRKTKPSDPWFHPVELRFRVDRAKFGRGDLSAGWLEDAVRNACGVALGQPRVLNVRVWVTDGTLALRCAPQCTSHVEQTVLRLTDVRGRPVGAVLELQIARAVPIDPELLDETEPMAEAESMEVVAGDLNPPETGVTLAQVALGVGLLAIWTENGAATVDATSVPSPIYTENGPVTAVASRV